MKKKPTKKKHPRIFNRCPICNSVHVVRFRDEKGKVYACEFCFGTLGSKWELDKK